MRKILVCFVLIISILMQNSVSVSASSERYLYDANMHVTDDEGGERQSCYLADMNGKTTKFFIDAHCYDVFGDPIDIVDVEWSWKLVSYNSTTNTFGEDEIDWHGVTLTDTGVVSNEATAELNVSPEAQVGCFAIQILFHRKEDSSLSNHGHYAASFKPIYIIANDSKADLSTFDFNGNTTLDAPTMENGSARFYFNSYALDQYQCPVYLSADWTMTDSDNMDVLDTNTTGITRCTTGFWDGCFVIDLSPEVKEGTYTITAKAKNSTNKAVKLVTIKKEPGYIWGVHMTCAEVSFNYENRSWTVLSTDVETNFTITAYGKDQYGQPMEVDSYSGFIWGLTDSFENVDGVNVKTELNGIKIESNAKDSSVATVAVPPNTNTEVQIYAGVRSGQDFICYPYLMKITTEAETEELCGDNAKWNLNENGVLTISGTGEMYDFSENNAPWEADKSKIKEVIIENGITKIGSYAFVGCPDGMIVRIPPSVNRISKNVFALEQHKSVYITNLGKWCNVEFEGEGDGGCLLRSNLYLNDVLVEHLIIPENVTSISPYAFKGCESITEVTIHKNVVGDYDCWFGCCWNLKQINVDADNPRYCSVDGNLLSKDKKNFYQYSLGKQDSEFTLSKEVVKINHDAFWCSENLQAVIIPDGVEEIEEYAFMSCSSLEEITIPKTITTIRQEAFWDCPLLTTVRYGGNAEDWAKIEILSGNEGLISAYENSNNTDDFCGENLSWTLDENGVLTISGTGEMYDFDHNAPWESNKNKIKEVIIGNGVTKIGAHSFCGCRNLQSVRIPKTVSTSGNSAFTCEELGGNVDEVYIEDLTKWCQLNFDGVRGNPLCLGADLYLNDTLVEELIIPEDVTEIGWSAFYGCNSIKKAVIHAYMTGGYFYIFNSCNNLEEIIVDSDNPEYSSSNGVLFNKNKTVLCQYPNGKKDTIYNIPDGVTQIADEAFFNCSNLQSVILPDSVKQIGNSCFNGCSALKKIEIPEGVTELPWWVFSRCKSLESVIIPKTVISIYDNAFNSCISLADVYFNGSQKEWENIDIAVNNDALVNSKVHFKFTKTTVSADKKSFTVTPINIEPGKTVILALYDGGKFVEFQKATYEGENLIFTTDKAYTEAKVMVWDGFATLKPVCDVEELN